MKKILDLCCGMKKYRSPGNKVIGIDKLKLPNVDVVHDIEKGLPFKDNEFDYTYSAHTLEHVHNLIPLMEELWRVCKKGALIEIIVPYWVAAGAHGDPTHVHFFTYNTFDYFDPENSLSKLFPYSKARFQIIEKRITMFPERPAPEIERWYRYRKLFSIVNKIINPIINTFPMIYQNTFLVFLLPAKEIHFVLRVIK